MALVEKYINNLTGVYKQLFRKYKLLHTCRMLVDPSYLTGYYDSVNSNNCNHRSLHKLNCILINSKQVSLTNQRHFFSFSGYSRRKIFTGRKLVGFSMEEMFDVVNDVPNYKEFLPFCKKSYIKKHEGDKMQADLVIGFPPVVEKYTSHIRFSRPRFILAESRDASLFDHLVTNWKFAPGLSNNPRSCVIMFYISFEFKSILHSHLANMFFTELVNQMESAFYREAIRRYGQATIPALELKVNNTSSFE